MVAVLCEICGNPLSKGVKKCPFCGAGNDGVREKGSRGFSHRTVNLEAGRPVLEVALRKLDEVLGDGARNGVNVLTLIHGYGSSGRGGVIRTECRKSLEYMKGKGVIRDYIPGEDFYSRVGAVKDLLRRYPALKQDKNLNRGNRGLTLVVF